MYIEIKNIKGKRTINLDYPIPNGPREIALIKAFTDVVDYKLDSTLEFTLSIGPGKGKKILEPRTYKSTELNSILSGDIDFHSINKNPKVVKINKLANVRELNFYINEIDNTENFIDGRVSSILMTYELYKYKNILLIEPINPQYKRLVNNSISSLTLTITDQNGNLIDLEMNVILHVKSKN